MSSRNTIFLTNDNEHAFFDCSEPLGETQESTYNDALTIEFSKQNIRIDLNDEDDLIITIINPNSEIYKIFRNLDKIVPTKNK